MDLTGLTSFKVSYNVDLDNILTITFKDVTGMTTLGEIVIENPKAKALMDMLAMIASERVNPEDGQTIHRMFYLATDNLATVEFV